jgi:diguanylate cyclase (GGDEF)-like protein
MSHPITRTNATAAAAQDQSWTSALLQRAMAVDATARAASFGRWWFAARSGQMLLSREAAGYLGEYPGLHADLADCFSSVLPEDLVELTACLVRADAEYACEFRLLDKRDGLRWMRLVALPQESDHPGLVEGIVSDITAVRHAAMREEFSFESTQLMIGTHTLDDAVSKMIALVCTDLGWDCGMYWSMEAPAALPGAPAVAIAADAADAHRLVCSHIWIGDGRPTSEAFSPLGGRRRLSIAANEGVVGGVWSSGEARWIDDFGNDPEFLYPQYARQLGIRSGFAFPVAYEGDDGLQHRPGVLIFFSCLARQPTAQLPKLSAAIGGLIAQTAQRMAQQESIRQLAQVDVLCGLANRRHFHALLDAACRAAALEGTPMGMLYVDLDRFKPINDGLGHATGDEVLRQFAARLAALTPADGMAGRVGGDEFALFLTGADALARLRELAESVLLAARTRFEVDGRELAISASVGISTFPDDGASGAELLRHADTAMYRVKRSGRNGLSFFSQGGGQTHAASQIALLQQLTVEAELLHAIAGDQLFMEYQPVYNIDTRAVRAVEGLIRWRRPNGDIMPPDVFIPIAEQSHLIVDIGRWVIRQACRDLAAMQAAGMAGVQLNVNMAALEFMNVNLPGELALITEAAGIDPRHVCLELTEGMMMNHADQVIPVMRALRQRGFKISVDDFGMGYSSLSRLKDLPISSLKIDRSFVHGLPSDHQDRAIVQTIVDIGRNMALDVIAEGVETDAQLQHLRALGCLLVQGYLLGRPVSLAALVQRHGEGPPGGATGPQIA